MKKIKIIVGKHNFEVNLFDTNTAKLIYESCPIESYVNTWGEEIYFNTNILLEKESTAKQIINKGEIAFWVEGSSIAIGFGPTPISIGDEIRLAAKVNIFGDTKYKVSLLSDVKDGDKIFVNKY